MNGPGKLTKYLKINKSHNKLNLFKDKLIKINLPKTPTKYITTTRIGIKNGNDLNWRYVLK